MAANILRELLQLGCQQAKIFNHNALNRGLQCCLSRQHARVGNVTAMHSWRQRHDVTVNKDVFTGHSSTTAMEDQSELYNSSTCLNPSKDCRNLDEETSTLSPVPNDEEDLEGSHSPIPMQPSFNLVPYVEHSQVLQRLVALGVDLSAVEKVKTAADFLMQADWETDIQPRLLFLKDAGVADDQLGHVLTKNPLVLKEGIEDMRERVKYLQSKKFSQEQVTHILTKAPLTLLLSVTYIDKKLGFLQKNFQLTGDEVRMVASKMPKIIPWKLQKLKDIRFYMREMLGFSERELKAMLLVAPKVYMSEKHQLGARFDFLHNVMGLTHQHLAAWPAVFRTRLHILQQRHRFLLLRDRAQYDPTKENYVSLQALVSGKDRDFCFHVAKASTTQFYNFLKTL